MRLQKYLARAGAASRRAGEVMIKEGRVQVNGERVTVPGTKVNPGLDRVSLDGRLLDLEGEKAYILLYKPAGCVTTVEDPWGRPTVLDFLPGSAGRVFPVGRLDLDAEGLLLLTSDGDLAYRLTHPRYQVKKKYRVTTRGIPPQEKLKELEKGVPLEEGLTSPAKLKFVQGDRVKNRAVVEIVIHEGRKRQVKRMFEYIGFPLVHLKRTGYSFLGLEGLKPKQHRCLAPREIVRLKKEVGLPPRYTT